MYSYLQTFIFFPLYRRPADLDNAYVPFIYGVGNQIGFTDIVKALCLGARAVLVSRPPIYGLSIAGKSGAESVLQGLLADLWQSMGLAGIHTIAECSRERMMNVKHGGDTKAMM